MTRLPTGCRYTLWLFNSSPWKTAHLKMVYLLKMVIFHGYVKLPEGKCRTIQVSNFDG